MTKVIFYFLFVMGVNFLGKPNEVIDNNISVESMIIENTSMDKSSNKVNSTEKVTDIDRYSEYLEVLNQGGPKEESPSYYSSENKKPNQAAVSNSDQVMPEIAKETASDDGNIKTTKPISKEKKNTKVITSVNHKAFGDLLKKYVDNKGNVNYAGFKNDQSKLDKYIQDLGANKPGASLSRNERLAYWINLYNAGTIKLILDNYPVSSIRDIAGGKPWDKAFLKVGTDTYSLNTIENEIIRPEFNEPRIHFAVNCAAASCPPLLNDAYYPAKLEAQLTERTRSFLSNKSYNTINANTVEISKIFEWYAVDFGDLKSFISSQNSVKVTNQSISYKEYNWSLNKQ